MDNNFGYAISFISDSELVVPYSDVLCVTCQRVCVLYKVTIWAFISHFVRLEWGEGIFHEVLESNIADGNWGNQQFLPELPKSLLKLIDVFPLWSGVMATFFGYGGPTATSTVSENNFNDVKHRIFRHLSLPIRIDEFVLWYIKVLSGKVKLQEAASLESEISHATSEGTAQEGEKKTDENDCDPDQETATDIQNTPHNEEQSNTDDNGKLASPTSSLYNQHTENTGTDGNEKLASPTSNGHSDKEALSSTDQDNAGDTLTCPECSTGNYPDGENCCFFCTPSPAVCFGGKRY